MAVEEVVVFSSLLIKNVFEEPQVFVWWRKGGQPLLKNQCKTVV